MLALLPPDAPLEQLRGELPPDGIRLAELSDAGPVPAAAAGAEFCVLDPRQRDRFASVLPELAALRVVQTLNAGVDWVPPLPEGVLLCNSGTVHDGPVSEWIVGVILAMAKDLPHYLNRQRAGQWDASGNTALAGGEGAGELAEQNVLVVGHGSIGRALARRLEPFGATVTGVARHPRPGVPGPEELPRLLPAADVVVLLAPATAQTRGLVGEQFLGAMKPGALLVNAARGSLVDTSALLGALRSGRIRAALDATDPEPLPAGHPLWSAPGVLITPHVAGSSARWRARAWRMAAAQMRRFAAGQALENVRPHGY
jgi:phosphoglycerate dehydrogenase-like enzyme